MTATSDFSNSAETPTAARLDDAIAGLARHNMSVEGARKAFQKKYASTASFAESRIFDILPMVRDGDPKHPESIVASFYRLNERLFPVEGERETPEGLKAYVQPYKGKDFPANDRRILVVLDETRENVIAAAVFGTAAVPEKLRQKSGIDGAVGVTYVMVDESYRMSGLGRYLATEAIPASAKSFLSTALGKQDPKIVMGAEINDVKKLTLDEAITDVAGAYTLPHARQNFWNKSGFFPLQFDDYSQLKLRPGLEAFSALRFHVAGWDKDKPMPSELPWYLIKSHAVLCLNKQAGLDDDDQSILRRMQRGLMRDPLAAFSEGAGDYKAKDAHLIAALQYAAAQTPAPTDRLVGQIMADYDRLPDTVKAPARTQAATPITKTDLDL